MSSCRTITLPTLLVLLVLALDSGAAAPAEPPFRIEDFENFLDMPLRVIENSTGIDRNSLTLPFMRWPERTIPYRIDPAFNEAQAGVVRNAMRALGGKSCLEFEEYDEARHRGKPYMNFKHDDEMCGTRVGRLWPFSSSRPSMMGSAHDIMMTPMCLTREGVAMHEVMHALGMYHEQSRSDRDDYIEVDYSNIDRSNWSQFSALPKYLSTTYNTPYDLKSIMHYSNNAFAIDPSKPTMRVKGASKAEQPVMGQLEGPSENDWAKLRAMYNCE